MYCWGDNEHGELSVNNTNTTTTALNDSSSSSSSSSLIPNVSPIIGWNHLTPWEYVRHISTSSSHTILSTNTGSVYTCGDGSEGALGHGDLQHLKSLKPVFWFTQQQTNTSNNISTSSSTPYIVSVCAGSDLFGSHSMALDDKGKVYTWGIGSACGRGSRKPLPEPGMVQLVTQNTQNNNDNQNDENDDDDDQGQSMSDDVKIKQIDCGGGYCMAVSHSGVLYTWGNWVGGRLGLGPVPSKVDESYIHGRSRKKLLPLLLHPRKVIFDHHQNQNQNKGKVKEEEDYVKIISVSCGDAHTAAITSLHSLLVWGSNESGQLGLGPSMSSGQLEAVFKPKQVPQFYGGFLKQQHVDKNSSSSSCVKYVTCGAAHTLVIDGLGYVWTWGGLGGACLGLGGSQSSGGGDSFNGLRPRHTFRPTSELQAARSVRQRSSNITAEIPSWSIPNKCESLNQYKNDIMSASLGERHSIIQLQNGKIMMCGDGVGLAHQLASKEKDDDDEKDDNDKDGLSSISVKDLIHELDEAEPISIMKTPNASWFSTLEGKHIINVACGGQHTIILTRGERIGFSLGYDLLQATKRSSSIRKLKQNKYKLTNHQNNETDDTKDKDNENNNDDDEDNDDDDDERAWNDLDILSEGCDCVMITSGSILPAHRFILASRSPYLRDLILEEERPNIMSGNVNEAGRGGGGHVLELLLPELRHDTALALREYLYTDTLPSSSLQPGSSLPLDLMKIAKRYELDRLYKICYNIVRNSHPSMNLDNNNDTNDNTKMPTTIKYEELPPSQIAHHFSTILGDKTWADVIFIADGKPIYAHIAILSSVSEYFSKMFQFNKIQSSQLNEKDRKDKHKQNNKDDEEEDDGNFLRNSMEPLEVEVPDSYLTMLRMLLWIYTGFVDSAEDSILLEDMLVADRFQLLDLKLTCESLVEVSPENCIQVIEVAHMVNAHRLSEDAFDCLSRHLHIKEVRDQAIGLLERNPELSESIFKCLNNQCYARTRDKHHVATISHKEATEDEKLTQQHGVFPIIPLLLSVFFAFIYAYSSRFVIMGPLVPIINGVGLIAIIVWGVRSARSA